MRRSVNKFTTETSAWQPILYVSAVNTPPSAAEAVDLALTGSLQRRLAGEAHVVVCEQRAPLSYIELQGLRSSGGGQQQLRVVRYQCV
jgi:hypothetical protein